MSEPKKTPTPAEIIRAKEIVKNLDRYTKPCDEMELLYVWQVDDPELRRGGMLGSAVLGLLEEYGVDLSKVKPLRDSTTPNKALILPAGSIEKIDKHLEGLLRVQEMAKFA